MSYYIIIRGPLGSGKSTISEKLAKKINGKHLAIDRILDDNNLLEDKEDGYISQKSFRQANEIACQDAKSIIQQGTPVVFDGNFYWQSQIDDLIKWLDFPHYVFTLKASLELCIERDRQREKPLGEMAARVVYKKSTEFDYGTVIDISKPLDKAITEILSYLPKTKS